MASPCGTFVPIRRHSKCLGAWSKPASSVTSAPTLPCRGSACTSVHSSQSKWHNQDSNAQTPISLTRRTIFHQLRMHDLNECSELLTCVYIRLDDAANIRSLNCIISDDSPLLPHPADPLAQPLLTPVTPLDNVQARSSLSTLLPSQPFYAHSNSFSLIVIPRLFFFLI